MELEKPRGEIRGSKTFDEVSMERSMGFVTALQRDYLLAFAVVCPQELKNLRPQLYSAADYCEKSYVHSEQKQMVLDNLKDYTVQALVNAIDHLGTVAFKLSDILEEQTLDVSSMELKLASLKQKLLTCQTYTDEEGIRQQQLLAIIPRHHKHYILPNSVNKKVHFSPHVQTDPRQSAQARARHFSSGASAANTLSWHLASETKSTLKSSAHAKASGAFNLLDAEENTRVRSTPPSAAMQTHGVARWHPSEVSKPMTPYRSFEHSTQRGITLPPVRSKSVLLAFFVKQKTSKAKTSF